MFSQNALSGSESLVYTDWNNSVHKRIFDNKYADNIPYLSGYKIILLVLKGLCTDLLQIGSEEEIKKILIAMGTYPTIHQRWIRPT